MRRPSAPHSMGIFRYIVCGQLHRNLPPIRPRPALGGELHSALLHHGDGSRMDERANLLHLSPIIFSPKPARGDPLHGHRHSAHEIIFSAGIPACLWME